MNILDTEHWHLEIKPKWVVQPKYNPISTECGRCSGYGTIGGGFKDLDDPRTCDVCFGTGTIKDYPVVPERPEIPQDFIKHMRSAYLNYLETKQKEQNVSKEPNPVGTVSCATVSTKASTTPEPYSQ